MTITILIITLPGAGSILCSIKFTSFAFSLIQNLNTSYNLQKTWIDSKVSFCIAKTINKPRRKLPVSTETKQELVLVSFGRFDRKPSPVQFQEIMTTLLHPKLYLVMYPHQQNTSSNSVGAWPCIVCITGPRQSMTNSLHPESFSVIYPWRLI